jgi:threonine/homoserine/homoserine lactone efflux protein
VTVTNWFAFAIASALMGIIPGPGVASIVGYALSSGRRSALAAVGGMACGNLLAMTVSVAGAGTVLAASATGFTILKWAGAACLIGLGVYAIMGSRVDRQAHTRRQPISPRTAYLGTLAIATFHPKTIIFFVAFVPQVIRPQESYVPQAAILTITYVCVVACTDTAYALMAVRAGTLLRSPAARSWTKRAGGGALIAAGVATASSRS